MLDQTDSFVEEVKLNGPVMEEWINQVLKIQDDDQSLVPRKVRDVADRHRTAA
jgi:hypothetical protein